LWAQELALEWGAQLELASVQASDVLWARPLGMLVVVLLVLVSSLELALYTCTYDHRTATNIHSCIRRERHTGIRSCHLLGSRYHLGPYSSYWSGLWDKESSLGWELAVLLVQVCILLVLGLASPSASLLVKVMAEVLDSAWVALWALKSLVHIPLELYPSHNR
jgi:hypothetical protein